MLSTTLFAIRKSFPSVEHVSTDTVYQWLRDTPERLKLLDVREEDEYAVSRIDNAVCVSPSVADDVDTSRLRSIAVTAAAENRDRIICYCSLGYRSSALADRLRKVIADDGGGMTLEDGRRLSVCNIDGSIFKWANEGKPVVDSNGQETTLVHPYDALWGKLLNSKCRSKK